MYTKTAQTNWIFNLIEKESAPFQPKIPMDVVSGSLSNTLAKRFPLMKAPNISLEYLKRLFTEAMDESQEAKMLSDERRKQYEYEISSIQSPQRFLVYINNVVLRGAGLEVNR